MSHFCRFQFLFLRSFVLLYSLNCHKYFGIACILETQHDFGGCLHFSYKVNFFRADLKGALSHPGLSNYRIT